MILNQLMKIIIFALTFFSLTVLAVPPYKGTIFVDSDIITDSDPTTYVSKLYQGMGQRLMFDNRINEFRTFNVHLYDVSYSDNNIIEFQINSEFDQVEAEQKTTFYATAIGRIPAELKSMVRTVWMHRGDEAFGGGNDNILIHTGSIAQSYIADGILEEVLVHESTHTSIDPNHAEATSWLVAQQADADFISTYAQSNPTQEDLAETLLMYLAVTYRSDRISNETKQTIENTIPNRINYITDQNFDFSLLGEPGSEIILQNGFE